LIPFILKQLEEFNIAYPKKSLLIRLDPQEVYTYTKTKEVKEREKRALQLLHDNGASVISFYRLNSGVKIKVLCKNNHTLISNMSTILNGIICKKCITS